MSADIDVDFLDRNLPLELFPHIAAALSSNGRVSRHNTGVYFQNIPTNPLNGLASIPYKEAERLGYFKIDFLNNTIYEHVRDNAHLMELMNREPAWDLLAEEEFVEMLAHLHSHFDIVNVIKPKSVNDLALVLALIRPGKRHLLHCPKEEIEAQIWSAPDDGSYHFKQSHSFAYAVSIVVQMNALAELGASNE